MEAGLEDCRCRCNGSEGGRFRAARAFATMEVSRSEQCGIFNPSLDGPRRLALTVIRNIGDLVLSSVVRALVAYSMASTYVRTTLDYLESIKKYSGFNVDYLHVTHDSLVEIDFEGYDVIFHNYCARLCFEGYVSSSYRERLKAFRGLKILAVQDEYERTNVLKEAIRDIGFDIVLTCVPQDCLHYVYPPDEFPGTEFITVFTGYVPDDFAAGRPSPVPLAERPIFIGYRGRDIGGRYGRLGFDKFEVGRRMKEICDSRGIATDIAMDEASRIYGAAWFDFVGSCRAMLGSESGANVFDFDGSIEARFREMTDQNGGVPPGYAEFLPIVADREDKVSMGQISPRVFECALMRTPMVLFKGRYSDAIQQDEHYIALEKDFSNVDHVLERLTDIPALECMAERAFDHLVASGSFGYREFHRALSERVRSRLVHLSAARPSVPEVGDSPVPLLDEKGRLLERPTRWPVGSVGFELRQAVAEARIYRGEFDRLIAEFSRLRGIFTAELQRLGEVYAGSLAPFHAVWGARSEAVCASLREQANGALDAVLTEFDGVMARSIEGLREERAGAVAAAVEEGETAAIALAARLMLEFEKDGYFHMIEWIRQLNECYQHGRVQLELTHREAQDGMMSGAASGASFVDVLGLKLYAARLRVSRARSALVQRIRRFRAGS